MSESGENELQNTETSKNKDLDNSEFELRSASIDDLDTIYEWDEEAKLASTGLGFDDGESRKNYLSELLADTRHEMLVISNNGKRLGMVIYDTDPDPIGSIVPVDESRGDSQNGLIDILGNKNQQRRVHIVSMAVDSSQRKKGVGSNAMKLLEDRLASQGVRAVSFDTGYQNSAVQQMAKDCAIFKGKADKGYRKERLVGIKLLSPEGDIHQ